jgi:hypothetical protein
VPVVYIARRSLSGAAGFLRSWPVQGKFKAYGPFLRDGSERIEDEWQGCRLPALLD